MSGWSDRRWHDVAMPAVLAPIRTGIARAREMRRSVRSVARSAWTGRMSSCLEMFEDELQVFHAIEFVGIEAISAMDA